LSALLGEDEPAFFIFFLKNKCFYAIADFDEFAWVKIMSNGEFAGWNDTFGLISDIK